MLFFVLLMVIPIFSIAKSISKPEYRPDWCYQTPQPENSTYLYVVEHGVGLSQRDAINQAIARVFQNTANRIGQFVSTDEINRAVQEGTNYNVIGRNLKIPINKVCEFSFQNKRKEWEVYVLCQVAKSGNINPIFDIPNLCNEHAMFDKKMENYNQTVLLKNDLASLKNTQSTVDFWCYFAGSMMAVSGAFMQLAWIADSNNDLQEEYNRKVAIAGLAVIGASIPVFVVPSVVKISLKKRKRELERSIDSYIGLKTIPEAQLYFGITPNSLGIKMCF